MVEGVRRISIVTINHFLKGPICKYRAALSFADKKVSIAVAKAEKYARLEKKSGLVPNIGGFEATVTEKRIAAIPKIK
jgi:hypothetical protein